MFKNQLQELAQRSCFNFPSYACIREGPDHAPRFKATVNFNGEVFESPTFCSTLRQAEHAAAEVALDLLSNKGPSKALAARVLDETGVYKNLLQETVHKAGLKLPVYTTVQSGSGHVPLFSCTVELAGMSFQGESAKTKKQAQKNAAIGAWAALKQLSRSGSCASSSSSSPLLESGVNDEQEQIIVARYLVTLRPPELNKSAQRDQQCEQWRSGQVRRDLIPPFGDGSMQYQSWTYPHFSPEVDLYQNWPQERASQQQSRLLALPSSPMSPSTPQFFPFIRSIFQPGNGQYFLSTEQEPVPFVPGMGSFLYFTNSSIPLPIKSISQVTIQEMEENPQGEENWLHSDANSHCWPINFPSNASVFSPIEVPNPPNSLTSHSDWRIPDMLPEKAEYTGNSIQLEAKQTEHLNWNSPRCTDTRFRPRATSADDTKFRLQNPQSLDYLHHNNRPCMVNSTGLARGYRPPSSAAPVTEGNANAAVTGSLRPENSQPSTRTSVSGYSTRPWTGGIRNAGCMPSANFMAPAVHIRSVVPVCSAPPAKKVASPSQPGLFSGAENSRTKKPEGDISAASSELNQLQI